MRTRSSNGITDGERNGMATVAAQYRMTRARMDDRSGPRWQDLR
jgi:hypothetical protein